MEHIKSVVERIGKYIVHLDRLSFDQAEAVYARKRNQPDKSLGEIVIEMGFTVDTGIVSEANPEK